MFSAASDRLTGPLTSRDSVCPESLSLACRKRAGITDVCCISFQLYKCAGDLNSGPDACITHALPTEGEDCGSCHICDVQTATHSVHTPPPSTVDDLRTGLALGHHGSGHYAKHTVVVTLDRQFNRIWNCQGDKLLGGSLKEFLD